MIAMGSKSSNEKINLLPTLWTSSLTKNDKLDGKKYYLRLLLLEVKVSKDRKKLLT
jgi:hypothetical protein